MARREIGMDLRRTMRDSRGDGHGDASPRRVAALARPRTQELNANMTWSFR